MRRPQLTLDLDRSTDRKAPSAGPTEAEKRAVRARQGGLCATCGKTSQRALDVVRRNGVLVAFCRRDRLRYDAPTRCAKGASRRRRSTRKPKRAPPRQLEIREQQTP